MKRFRMSDEAGVSMLDAAVTIPVFILVMFFIIDAARTSYLAVSLQDSLHSAARWTITGETHDDHPTSRVESVKEILIENAARRGITINRCEIFICPIDVPDCTCPIGGDPCVVECDYLNPPEEVIDSGRLFKISARTRLSVPMTLYAMDIERTAVGRNEAF